eukprot:202211-Pyramimonas_sp.AAC.1
MPRPRGARFCNSKIAMLAKEVCRRLFFCIHCGAARESEGGGWMGVEEAQIAQQLDVGCVAWLAS